MGSLLEVGAKSEGAKSVHRSLLSILSSGEVSQGGKAGGKSGRSSRLAVGEKSTAVAQVAKIDGGNENHQEQLEVAFTSGSPRKYTYEVRENWQGEK